ncbi:hypothetical protein F2P79_025545 [Pimephales promelas]|nr:hypothetical protein F2P79_025545 [Pimephales promelas]
MFPLLMKLVYFNLHHKLQEESWKYLNDSHIETPVLIQTSGDKKIKVLIISGPLLAVVMVTVILYRNYKQIRLKKSDNLKTDPEIQRDDPKHSQIKLQKHRLRKSSASTEMEKNLIGVIPHFCLWLHCKQKK